MEDRHILVIGGSRRIGLEVSRHLVKSGVTPIVTYRREPSSDEGIRALVGGGNLWKMDITDEDSVLSVQRMIREKGLVLDGMINCAGVYFSSDVSTAPFDSPGSEDGRTTTIDPLVGAPTTTSPSSYRDMNSNVNARGAFLVTLHLGRHVVDGGVIIHISDIWAGRVRPGYRDYSASKASLEGLISSAARELAPRLSVYGIAPGPVLLEEGADDERIVSVARGNPMGRVGSPLDILSAIDHLISNVSIPTGTIVSIDGGRSLV